MPLERYIIVLSLPTRVIGMLGHRISASADVIFVTHPNEISLFSLLAFCRRRCFVFFLLLSYVHCLQREEKVQVETTTAPWGYTYTTSPLYYTPTDTTVHNSFTFSF